MIAVIYARYSSDKQDSTSIDDQVSVCRARAERDGLEVASIHADGAISGSTQVGSREGGKALLADAMAARFDVLLLEGLDRLSRDQVEQESIVRRLEHRGIRIIGVCDGYDSEAPGRKVMRGVRGLINEIYLDDLRAKTHRGMAGQFDRGYIAGGKVYGYDIERDEQGSRYVINEAEAAVVKWIFQQAAEGKTFRHISHSLNAEGTPSPRGKRWSVSVIYGSPVKGTGIINNPLYAGRYIWNRSQWVKDPDTGKRKRVERPRSEWRQVEMPNLRIIDAETWRRVRVRIDTGRDEFGRKQAKRPARSLLGGILRCPHCGGPMAARDTNYYGCSVAHNQGEAVCADYRIHRPFVEQRLVTLVRKDLLSASAARMYEREFKRHLSSNGSEAKAKKAKARLAEIEREIQRLIDAIVSVGSSAALSSRLKAAERERDSLLDIVGAVSEQMELPDIRSIFKQQLLNLGQALKGEPETARAAMGDIFGRIDLQLRGEQVWGQIQTSPALMLAAGDALNSGSGGAIPPLEVRLI